MKKAMTLLVLLALMVSVLAAIGCGEKETTVSTPGDNVTVSEDDDNGSVTITGEDGTTFAADDKAPTEDELGAPIYPGAEYVKDSGGTLTTTTDGETSTMSSGEFTTTDSYGKVVEWYNDRLGTPFTADSEDTIWMPDGSGGYDATTVQVTAGDGKVTIIIANLGS